MTLRLIAVAIMIAGMAGFGIAATVAWSALVDAVNAKLPAEDRFEPLGWWIGKSLRLVSAYRRLYPGGTLVRRHGVLVLGGVACVTATAALIGFDWPEVTFLAAGGTALIWWLYFPNPDRAA